MFKKFNVGTVFWISLAILLILKILDSTDCTGSRPMIIYSGVLNILLFLTLLYGVVREFIILFKNARSEAGGGRTAAWVRFILLFLFFGFLLTLQTRMFRECPLWN